MDVFTRRDSSAFEEARHTISEKVDHVGRLLSDTDRRLEVATACGEDLAHAVMTFLGDPQGVGTDELAEAYGRFMAAHAGNFAPSSMPPDRIAA